MDASRVCSNIFSEVGITTGVELVGALDLHATVAECARDDSVQERGAELALDIVAYDRKTFLGELLGRTPAPRLLDGIAGHMDRLAQRRAFRLSDADRPLILWKRARGIRRGDPRLLPPVGSEQAVRHYAQVRNCLPLWVDQGDGGVVGSTKD